MIGSDGIGCEPASAVTLAGIKKMVNRGQIHSDEDVVAILTGHLLKDPEYTVAYHSAGLHFRDDKGETHTIEPNFANELVRVKAERDAILEVLDP